MIDSILLFVFLRPAYYTTIRFYPLIEFALGSRWGRRVYLEEWWATLALLAHSTLLADQNNCPAFREGKQAGQSHEIM